MKKTLLISLPIVTIISVVAIYLFGVPAIQTNNYKTEAGASQLTLASSAEKAVSAANQDAFFAESVTATKVKNALKISKATANDLEAKIQSNEKTLTSFTELPYVSTVNSNYKATLDLKVLEERYVKSSKDYLAELKSVNTYNEQTLPILEISQQAAGVLDKFKTAKSEAEILAVIDTFIGMLDKADKIAASIKPAESTKEMHEFNQKDVKEITAFMKEMRVAVRAMDVAKLTTLSQNYEKKMASDKKEFKKLTAKLTKESKLAKIGSELDDLNKQVKVKTAEL